jgi:uncharacterized protein (DUF1800 family)
MSAAAAAARRKRRPMVQADAARHLRRATLGVQLTEIAAATGQRVDQWVDAQLALPVTVGQMRTVVNTGRIPGFPTAPATDLGWPGANQWLNWKFQQPEKLRTRIVYALLEYFSVGGLILQYGNPRAHSVLWDIFEQECVGGSFRIMIERVTRSQTMASWLTYWRNTRTDGVRQPDENYAREIMQLYTIGLWELNLDGSRRLTGQLDPSDPRYVLNGTAEVPTYGQSDIANVARVFTGMTATESYDGGATTAPINDTYQFGPGLGAGALTDAAGNTGYYVALRYAPAFHESTLPKVALQGRINVPGGADGDTSLAATLDALTVHPSTAPFFCREMIRLLTTSNPSPAYVARVASVFQNDGTGAVGNLRAVFRAIFLDQEVLAPVDRGLTMRVPSFEEQRLALVLAHAPRLTTEGAPLASGTGAFPGSQDLEFAQIGMDWESELQTFQNRSVFGRWPKEYRAAGGVFNAGLISPELATFGESQTSDLLNSSQVFQRIGNMARAADRTNALSTGNRAALLADLSLLLTGGTAPPSFLTELSNFLATRTANDSADGVSETYRSVAAALWLSPWGLARR